MSRNGRRDDTRVVITGMGAVTPLGVGLDAYWQGLVEGRSGISVIDEFDATNEPVRIAGYVKDFDPSDFMDRKTIRRQPRFAHLAIAATAEALEDAGLEIDQMDPERIAIEMGNAIGTIETITGQYDLLQEDGARRLTPGAIPGVLINMAACSIAMRFGITGPGATPAAACATGIYAVGDAFRRLQRGEVDVVIAGACDSSQHPLAVGAFWRIGALSTRNDDPEGACRPFDAERDGTVMSEGAATLILETEEHARARGARILAEIVGYGQSQDAFHVIAPDPEGKGAAQAMRKALDEAGLAPGEVDWISAHGTGTPLNDLSETLAIKRVFGEHAYDVPVSALKSMTGHMLGAAGAASIAANVQAIREGIIPPTINYHVPDPECDLDYVPNEARRAPVEVAISNAFGFGGQNGCLVVRRYRP